MKTQRFTQGDAINIHGDSRVGSNPSRHCRTPGRRFRAILAAAVFVLAATGLRASDPIGAFARIDKVVFEPSDSVPDRVQLWGTFCLADPKDRDSYLAPEKGYLYYKLPAEKPDVARKEWNDLKAVAGSGEVIGFGSRHGAKTKVRSANEKPENPDVYSVGFGLVKTSQRGASYPPIKALMSHPDKKSSASKGASPNSPGRSQERIHPQE